MRRKQLLRSLENQLEKLGSTLEQLEEEKERLMARFEALGFLVCHQSILLNLHLQLDGLPPLDLRVPDPAVSSVIDDVVASMPHKWPLLNSLLQLQLPRYAAVMRTATPAELATTWTSLVQEIALMLHLHKRQVQLSQAHDEQPQQQQQQEQQPAVIKAEQQQPEQQQPEPQPTGAGNATYDQLVQAVVSCMHLMKAGYLLRPRLMHSMIDFDLTKLQHIQVSPAYWGQVIVATDLSLRQRHLIREVVAFVTPKLRKLEAEGQELAAVTDALKCLDTDPTPATSSGTIAGQAAGCGDPAALPAAAGPATPGGSLAIDQEQVLQLLQQQQQQEQQGPAAAASGAAASATATASTSDPSSPLSWLDEIQQLQLTQQLLAAQERKQQQQQQQQPQLKEMTLQTSLLTHAMLDELCGNLASWRVLTQMRGSIAYMLQPEQMAAGILACFPLMPLGSLVVDQMRDSM